MRAQHPSSRSSEIAAARESVTLSESLGSVKARTLVEELIGRAFVIQIRSEPALDCAQFQAFAALIIEYLIAADFAHGKITGLRMRKI
jgi:hypothetical protein